MTCSIAPGMGRTGSVHLAGAALALLLSSGCTTAVYHPLTGFHRPVALEPRADTFKGLTLEITCLPGDVLERADAERLCRHARRLFADQGATVETKTRLGASAMGDAGGAKAPPTGPVLKLDLSGRTTRVEANAVSWVLFIYTLTLVPAVSEQTFVQEVVVRDDAGFLLASDTWAGRIVEYVGAGYWTANFALDHTVRAPEDVVTGDACEKNFSRDFDRQLTQIVFNARARWALLQESSGPPPPRPSDPAKAVN